MKFRRLLPVFAAAALLAACSTPSEEQGGATNTGTGSTATTTTKGGPAAGSAEEFMTVVGDRVFFSLNQYTLAPEAQSVLARQAAWLKQYANRTVVIEGHADERGTREYNIALGERRAAAVKDFLVAQGVQPARIARVISYGKERPVCAESTEACWGKNRRGVTVLQ